MQFRQPFEPLPSDHSRQPNEFPTQQQVDLQQQLLLPQLQPPPIMQAQSSEKKSRERCDEVLGIPAQDKELEYLYLGK